jgi:hypothetical protein
VTSELIGHSAERQLVDFDEAHGGMHEIIEPLISVASFADFTMCLIKTSMQIEDKKSNDTENTAS